jgi:hypothetical protein
MSRFEAVPRGVRWAVFLPAGILATLIVNSVLEFVFAAVGLPNAPETAGGIARGALGAFAWALTLTFVPAVLSPRPWAVGLVMFAVGLMIRVSPVVSMMTVPYQRARLSSLAIAFTALIGAHVFGGGLGLFLIRDQALRRR